MSDLRDAIALVVATDQGWPADASAFRGIADVILAMPEIQRLLALRALIPEVIEQLEALYPRMSDGCLGGARGSDLDAIIAKLRAPVEGRET